MPDRRTIPLPALARLALVAVLAAGLALQASRGVPEAAHGTVASATDRATGPT